MKVFLEVNACEQRKLENERIRIWLIKNGHIIVNSPQLADYCIITTCGVDSKAISVSKKTIENMMLHFAPSNIIVGGCLPEIDMQYFHAHLIEKTFSPKNFEIINNYFPNNTCIENIEIPSLLANEANIVRLEKRCSKSYDQAKHGYKIVIATGCLNKCAYCAIKYATGKLKSRSIADIIAQINSLDLKKGSSIMLMAGDTGAYGQDIGTNFCELLQEILHLEKKVEIYIHDLNMNWIIKDIDHYLQVLNNDRHKCIAVMNIPIQSGSNRILKLMKRGYTSEQIIMIINTLKRMRPDVIIGTHIMVGFPSETEKDYNQTVTVLQKSYFDFITCFSYSEHNITESYHIFPKVEQSTIDNRLNALKKLFKEKIRI